MERVDIKKRDKTIDLIKGIGIFFMVGGHCGAPFTEFVCLFHMAIFIMASGYCYKQSNSNTIYSVFNFVYRKFKALWFPYVLWTAIYTLCHNFFIKINVYTNNPLFVEMVQGKYNRITNYYSFEKMVKNIGKAFMLQGGTQLGGAFWFLAMLLGISILYCILEFAIRHIVKEKYYDLAQAICAVVFLAIGYWYRLVEKPLWGCARIFSCYILFYIGYMIKKKSILCKIRKKTWHIVILLTCFLVLMLSKDYGNIDLGNNLYNNPVFLLLVSLSGWLFVYELASLIVKTRLLVRVTSCIGQNTLAIVILHFLCFKLVSYIGVVCEGKPLYLVAAFPVLYSGYLWYLAYLAVGIGIPLALSILWKNLRKRISLLKEKETILQGMKGYEHAVE